MEFEPILNNVTISNVIPSYATLNEMSLYTVAAVEESYTNIMKEIGIYELSLVMEEAEEEKKKKLDIKAIFTKFKDFVVGLLGKIAEAVKKARDKVEYFIMDKVKMIERAGKFKGSDLVQAVQKDKERYDKAHKDDKNKKDYYEEVWDSKHSDRIIYNKTEAGKIVGDIEKAVKKSNARIAVVDGKSSLDGKKYEEIEAFDVDEEIATAMGISKENVSDSKKFRDYIIDKVMDRKKDYKGSGKFVGIFWDEIKKGNALFDKEIKKPYTDCKTALDDGLKVAKKLDDAKSFKPLFKSAAAATKLMASAIGAIETVYIRDKMFAFRVVLHAAAIYHRQGGKIPSLKNESAVVESSTFQSELSSLFTF